MSISITDFWKLLAQSRLLTSQQVKQLATDFSQLKQETPATPKTVAEWLLAKNVVSRYQAAVVLAGRTGPFFFGDYKVYDRIEQGRLKGAYRGHHTATGHPVTLQFIRGEVAKDEQQWASAAKQASAASRIVSPHVQRYFAAVDLQSIKFLVAEDLRGKSLDERLSGGRFPVAEACRIARQMAIGLSQMHQGGRAHGDVRPANIFVETIPQQPANAKLLFEAHQLPGPIDCTQQDASGPLAAMADYLAPELTIAGKSPDAASDAYALGCTLHVLLTGDLPFAGGTAAQKLVRHGKEAPKALEQKDVPPKLAQVVLALMGKSPKARPALATVIEQLAAFVEPNALQANLPAPPASLASYEKAISQLSSKSAVNPAAITAAAAIAAPATVPPKTNPIGAEVLSSAPLSATPAAIASPLASPRGNSSAEELVRRRAAAQRSNRTTTIVAAVTVAAVALIGSVIWMVGLRPRPPVIAQNTSSVLPANVSPATAESQAVTGPSAAEAAAAVEAAANTITTPAGVRLHLVADDGKTPWASPTEGMPVSFRLVAPEAQAILVLRPAALLASAEGARVLAALGPRFASGRTSFEEASGVKFEEIERLIVSLHEADGGSPRVNFVVKTTEPIAQAKLLEKWGKPTAAKEKGKTYFTGANKAYFVSNAPEDAGTFAMGDARGMKEVAAVGGAPPLLFREMERLRRMSDSERHFTAMFYPQFLASAEGEALFAGELGRLRSPLAWLLGNSWQATSISLHCDDSFYLEMRMLPPLDQLPGDLARDVRGRLNQIPREVESYTDAMVLMPYWSRLGRRFPLMIGQLHQQLRVAVEGNHVLANSVLPGAAAHNLVLGGELLVSTTPGAAPAAAVASKAVSGAKTIDDALALKTTYTFDQESLEFAMRDLAADVTTQLKGSPVEFAIKILGDDLKVDGITRNQSIRDFKQENQTIADILTALVRKANPVTTVKDPSETDQKLLWLVGPDPENAGKQVVLITTRTAAKNKKYNLPAVFVAKGKK